MNDPTLVEVLLAWSLLLCFIVALASSGPRSIGAAIVFAAIVASIESKAWRQR